MKTKDLFVKCFITIGPHEDTWLVGFHCAGQKLFAMRSYHEVADALETLHEWMLLFSDETEVTPADEGAATLLRETLARLAVGEETHLPDTIDELQKRDDLRTWFEREMRKSQGEEK